MTQLLVNFAENSIAVKHSTHIFPIIEAPSINGKLSDVGKLGSAKYSTLISSVIHVFSTRAKSLSSKKKKETQN